MINIQDKKNCCGCGACVQRCPKQCITLHEDSEGFLYPVADASVCINCGLCEKVCPVINQHTAHEPLQTFAAKNPNEAVRAASSSGGVFTMLAESVIKSGGVVFGAAFDQQWKVVHTCATTIGGLQKFRGSKYLQSQTNNTFKEAEAYLKQGRQVLYSGTPCQVAGLKKYLRKDYDNLLTLDFICHGVPSPGVFRTYLRDEINRLSARQGGGKNTVLLPCIPLVAESDGLGGGVVKIQSVSFRDKRNGWKKYGFALGLSKASAAGEKNSVLLSYFPLNKDLFMRGFLRDLYLRPSCYACPAKQLKSGSDITLGDFWGIETLLPELDDDRGMSAVTVNTEKGKALLQEVNAELTEVAYREVVKRNSALVHSASEPKGRRAFFEADGLTFEAKIEKLAKTPFSLRLFIGKLAYSILPNKMLRNIIRHIRNIKKNK